MQSLIESLKQHEAGYMPTDQETLLRLQNVELAVLIGPAAVGKSTLIDAATDLDEDFTRSVGFTTRPMRPGEPADQYDFMDHTQENLEKILEQVQNGKPVQFKIHPETGFVYGSELHSYASPYVLIDIMSSAVGEVRKLPFRSMNELSVVCEPSSWDARFMSRQSKPKEAKDRLAEGIASLEWSLDQGADMTWIDNSSEDVYEIAANVISIVRGEQEPDQGARTVGERLLAFMRTAV